MRNTMDEYQTTIRKFKKRKRIADFGYFVSVFLLCLWFLTNIWELLFYDDSYTLFVGSIIAFVLIFILLSFIYIAVGVVIKSQIVTIMFSECDPEKYSRVLSSVYRVNRKTRSSMQATTAFFTGKFEDCLRYCDEAEKLNKPKLQYTVALNRARAAAMLGDKETLAAETEKMLQAKIKRESEKEEAKKVAEHYYMLYDLLDGNLEKADAKADGLQPASSCPLSEALCAYYRGLVYKAAAEKQKAIHCFMTASEKGGKMFIKAKSDEALNELLEENISSDQIQ